MQLKLFSIICFILLTASCLSQWSTSKDSVLQISSFGTGVTSVSDNEGGCYVAFSNFSYEKTRYYLQRIDKYGIKVWQAPLLILDTSDIQFPCYLAYDSINKQILVALQINELKKNNNQDVKMNQKIIVKKYDSSGKNIWISSGIRVSTDTTAQFLKKIMIDNLGGLVVVWHQYNIANASYPYSHYLQRVDSDGIIQWGQKGLLISDSLKYNEFEIILNGNTITYMISLSGRIVLKSINEYSNTEWIKYLSNDNRISFSKLCVDNNRNIYLVGQSCVDTTFCNYVNIIIRKLDKNGNNLWENDYKIIDSNWDNIRIDKIISSKNDTDRVYILFTDNNTVSGKTKVRFQIINSNGAKLLSENDTYVFGLDVEQYGLDMIKSDDNHVVLLWNDNRSGKGSYYVQKISNSGKKYFSFNGVVISDYQPNESSILFLRLMSDCNGGIITVGYAEPVGIFGQLVNKNGNYGLIFDSVRKDAFSYSSFYLFDNYPNPFNPNTTITYQLPKNSFVTLKIFDLLGREASVLVNESKNAGRHSASFDAARLSGGVYFYSLKAGSYSITKKMMLLK